ncbi:hypothetical protein L596_008797 [Steinernema carpocapsae]|uniref:Uncharacterized protein n=1 Tax=Steinernema carpocapsae TaxID=34508 RepID=A0A4U5PE21_STECR|nr:hypothetical protein L596_008797 [Steinernema carpocapsae]
MESAAVQNHSRYPENGETQKSAKSASNCGKSSVSKNSSFQESDRHKQKHGKHQKTVAVSSLDDISAKRVSRDSDDSFRTSEDFDSDQELKDSDDRSGDKCLVDEWPDKRITDNTFLQLGQIQAQPDISYKCWRTQKCELERTRTKRPKCRRTRCWRSRF